MPVDELYFIDMMSVSIIGVGRVGGAIALGLPNDLYSVRDLVYRSDAELTLVVAQRVPGASATAYESLGEITSDIIFITTQDTEIGRISTDLVSKIRSTPVIFHTSGALSSAVLGDLRSAGYRTGSIHPLVSVSNAATGPERFRGSYFCIEGSADALVVAEKIVLSLGGIPFTVDTQFKTLYHAAAVTACGHLVALFDASVEMMTKCGLSEDDSKKILLPLVKSTVQNLGEHSTAAALTGTFARADTETFVQHLKVLNTNVSDELLEIYLLLGERSLKLAAKQGVNAEKIDSLRTKVSIAKSKLKW